MFVVIILVSGGLIVDAFLSYSRGLRAVAQVLDDSWNIFLTRISSTDIPQEILNHKKEVEAIVNGTFESRTMGLLFQVYTAALISAGVYVLTRSRKVVETAKEEVKNAADHAQEAKKIAAETTAAAKEAQDRIRLIDPVLQDALQSVIVLAKAQAAANDVWLIRSDADPRRRATYFPKARDSARSLHFELDQMDRAHRGLSMHQSNLLWNQVTAMQAHLRVLPKEVKPAVAIIETNVLRSLDLLRKKDFVQRFDDRVKKIQD